MQSKAFDTLLALVRNSERLVLRDDMMNTVWPDSLEARTPLPRLRQLLANAGFFTNGSGFRLLTRLPGSRLGQNIRPGKRPAKKASTRRPTTRAIRLYQPLSLTKMQWFGCLLAAKKNKDQTTSGHGQVALFKSIFVGMRSSFLRIRASHWPSYQPVSLPRKGVEYTSGVMTLDLILK